MLARVCRSESSSGDAAAVYARLFSRRLVHRRVAKKSSKVEKSMPSLSEGAFEGESLKLRSGSHYIKCFDDAIVLFDEMV
ncbi:hypothetical protein ARALYDRAFT_893196 [Arabidopsis lyrata subsp. lyrata]|uniref:Uncharacterized protein n=1 Tax=Arabidopsis lyrata subsp. lyrata TaxID=81972 RepID=D7KU63_ARALL|nr:hypothetical protein ARALYDRAFT_893196 [Arabidopsis lyrata subsp. lyrata]